MHLKFKQTASFWALQKNDLYFVTWPKPFMFKFIHSLLCDLAWVSFLITGPVTFIPHAICGHSFRAPQCSSPSINSKRIKPQLLSASIMHNFLWLLSSSKARSKTWNSSGLWKQQFWWFPFNFEKRKQHKNRFCCSEKKKKDWTLIGCTVLHRHNVQLKKLNQPYCPLAGRWGAHL